MAYPTGAISNVNLANAIPKIWGSKINDFLRQKLNVTRYFTDRSDELAGGGDIIHTLGLTAMTANARSDNAVAVTLNAATEAVKDLTVNQWFETSFMIADREKKQVLQSYNLQERYMKNAAYTTAKKLEVAVTTLFASFTKSVGTTTVALSDVEIRKAFYTLGNDGGDVTEAVWFLNWKTVYGDIMTLDKYAIAINTANATNPVTGGSVPSILGRPVIISGNLSTANTGADYVGALATPDAIHYATTSLDGGTTGELNCRLQATYKQEYLGTLVTADILFGAVLNRDVGGGVKVISAV